MLPTDLQVALAASPKALAAWENISPLARFAVQIETRMMSVNF